MEETALELIGTKDLGFCGCGDTKSAVIYVHNALRQIADLKGLVWEDKLTTDEWEKQSIALFGSEGAKYFMWYYLSNMGLAEHGGSVPGWLTDKGEALLAKLDALKCKCPCHTNRGMMHIRACCDNGYVDKGPIT